MFVIGVLIQSDARGKPLEKIMYTSSEKIKKKIKKNQNNQEKIKRKQCL